MAESDQVLYESFHNGTITDNPLSSGATTINSSEFADLPVVAAPEFAYLVLDPLGVDGDPEIVAVTTHTSSATSITVTRGEQTALNGSAARAHNSGTVWRWPVTAQDLLDFRATSNDHINESVVTAAGDILYATGSSAVDNLPIGSDGQVLAVDSATSLPAWKGGMVLIEEISSPSGNSVSFASIPQTFSHLRIVGRAQHDNSSAANAHRQFRIRFNGSAAADYEGLAIDWEPGDADGANRIIEDTGATSLLWGYIGDVPSTFVIDIPDYTSNANNKPIESYGSSRVNPSSATSAWKKFVGTGMWETNAPITGVLLLFGSDAFSSGLISLYGLG